jgi:dsRNA-specific ribonuclease
VECTYISHLEKQIGYTFNIKDLLIYAVASKDQLLNNYHETETTFDQSKLAFLGDGLLTFLVSEYIIKSNKKTHNRGAFISNAHMAYWIKNRGLDKSISVFRSTTNLSNDHTLGTLFEAILYAIFLDCNQELKIVYEYLEKNYFNYIPQENLKNEALRHILRSQTKGKYYQQLNSQLLKRHQNVPIIKIKNPSKKHPSGKISLQFHTISLESDKQEFLFFKTSNITLETVEGLAYKALKKLSRCSRRK